MHIYFYLKHFPLRDAPFSEGVTKAVHGLACGLIHHGQSVTVIGEGPESGVRMSEYGYEIRVYPADDTHPRFNLSPALVEFLSTHVTPIDRVILNGIFHRSVYSVSKVLKRQNIPYIIAPHDPYHPAIFQKNKLIKTVYWHLKESRMLRSAAAVQLLDSRHAQWLQKRGIKSRTIALPNGFESQDVIPESHLTWPTNTIPTLYFLGRLDTYNKGLDLLLEAIAQITQSVPPIPLQLTIQGPDWGDRATLKAQMVKLGIEKYVTFLDPDFTARSAELAMQYDIFCVPSRFEGFSLSALEAMLAARVVLISSVAGLAPHVELSGCGLTIEPTVEGIRSGILALLQRRDRWHSMGRSGREYALTHLRWESIAAKALPFYRSLG
jgi:glycosyltransferase involved in cell wall biosynthesis